MPTRHVPPTSRPRWAPRPLRPIEAALDAAEAVVIAAATIAHAELIRASIARGLPTFCEKPLAADLDDTLAVADEIERSGVPFQLGFQRRFDAGYREARRLVETGELGTLYAVRLAGHDPAPPHESYIPASGGLFRDFSIHDFDILRWLTGREVEEVYADGGVRGFPVFAKYDDVDTAVATLRMTDGPFVVLTAARHDPLGYDIRAELFGSGDSVVRRSGARGRRSARSSRACRRRPVPPGPTSSTASRRPTPPNSPHSSGSRAGRSRARARPAMASPRCASQRRRLVRSTSTDRCDSRRSQADGRTLRSDRKEVARSRDGIGIPRPTGGVQGNLATRGRGRSATLGDAHRARSTNVRRTTG